MSSARSIPYDGCWNEAGVHGDGTCELLAEVVHCRNCRHFAEAAARIRDRTDAENDPSVTAATAAPLRSDGPRTRAFVFRIGREWLALPLETITEVLPAARLHSLPHRPPAVAGVAAWGGELVIAIALESVLSIETDGKAPARMIVAARGADRFVFPASEVAGAADLAELKKLPPSVKHAPRHAAKAVASWNQRSVTLLDAERLFKNCAERLS